MEEIWKDIEGYVGLYQVSSIGRVKSLNRTVYKNDNTIQPRNGKILKTTVEPLGYVHVLLSKNNQRKCYNIHRLVAEAFIPNPNNLPEVNHKDCDIKNNHVDNLEWCTRSYNINYGDRNKKMVETRNKKASYGAEKKVIQLTKENVIVTIYNSVSETARYGFEPSTVAKCARGVLNTHKGFKWEYAS